MCKLRELAQKAVALSHEMENAIIELVNNAGGCVDTSNEDFQCDTIYAYVWSEYDETYVEKRVVKVRTDGNSLIIKLDYALSEEEDCEYSIFGGLVLINATLYNLCECIEEYID